MFVSDPSDRVLLERLRTGDETAFRDIVLAHYSGLMAFVQRYVDGKDTAEDVLQDLFLRLWNRRENLFIRDSLKVYLYQSAKHQALDRIKHDRVEYRWAEQALALGAGGDRPDDPASLYEQDELTAAVVQAIAELPPRCAEVFRLSRDAGMSYQEIATTLGISTATVNTQITRAVAAIRRAIVPFLTLIALVRP